MIRYYYNFNEMTLNNPAPTIDLCKVEGYTCNYISNMITAGNEEKKLLQYYLWPRIFNLNVWYIDKEDFEGEPTASDLQKAAEEFKQRFYYIYQETYEKYIKLLGLYSGIENNLMKKLESEQITRYNDTPQSVNGGFDVSDTYVSNATKVNTSSDAGTPMQKLEEVRQLIRNLYNDWCNEFIMRMVIL